MYKNIQLLLITYFISSYSIRNINVTQKVLFLLLVLCFYGCEPYDGRLKFINNSDKVVYFSISHSENFLNDSYRNSFNETLDSYDYVYKLEIKDSIRITNFGKNSWYNYMTYAQDEHMHIHLFESDVLDSQDWTSIYQERKYLDATSYTLEELEAIDWRIIVPFVNQKSVN